MQIVIENMFYPEAFEMGISVATATETALAATAAISMTTQTQSSDLLIYVLVGTGVLLICCLVIYLWVEHQRETRELRAQY